MAPVAQNVHVSGQPDCEERQIEARGAPPEGLLGARSRPAARRALLSLQLVPEAMRLAKYLAHAGVASRRACEALIAAGRVGVDGRTVTDPARAVDEHSRVTLDARPLAGPEPRVCFAVNKPVGVLSTARDTHGRPTVLGLVPARGLRLYPVG